MKRIIVSVSAVVLVCAMTAPAGQPMPGLPGSAPDQLAGDLRGLLIKNLPTPLHEAKQNWGHQSDRRPLLRSRRYEYDAEQVHPLRNDGVWRKIRIDALNAADTLVFDLRNVAAPEAGKLTFQVFVALDTHFNYQQQRWSVGH